MNGCVQSVVYSKDRRYFPYHTHNHYQMIYVRQGRAVLRVASREYDVRSPCLVFISHLERHSLEIQSEFYERYEVNVDPRKANHSIKDSSLLSVFSNRPAQFCHVLDVDSFQTTVETLIQLLYEELRSEYVEQGDVATMLLKILLTQLNRRIPSAFPRVSSGISHIVWQVKKDLEQHLEKDITLDQIATQHSVSTYYLAHSFKKITGYSIKQYQLLCRLSATREFLGSTDLNITEISQRVGFGDMSNFSRYFRRYMGMTPTQYRRQVRNAGERDIDPQH